MTAGHFIFIPAVLLIGIIIGWILGTRAAADAANARRRRRPPDTDEAGGPRSRTSGPGDR